MSQRTRSNPGFGAYARNFRDGAVSPQSFSSKNFRYVYDEFRGPLTACLNTGAAYAGTTGATNILDTHCTWPYGIEHFVLGAGQTIKIPVLAAGGGLSIAQDLTSTEGADYVFGADQAGTTAGRLCFQSRVDRAFFARAKLTLADVSGVNPLYFGWKKATAANATFLTGATDFACVSIVTAANPAVIKTSTRLNSGSATDTSTGLTWADAATKTLEVGVDDQGYATMSVNGTRVPQFGFRFDDEDYLVPFLRFLHAATSPGAITLHTFECGFQAK